VLDIVLAHPDGASPPDSRRYDGILDGPYGDEGPGVGLMLGSDVISGDIAIQGPFVDFEVEQRGRRSTPILSEGYAELRAVDLPAIATVANNKAVWEVLLGDGRIASCRLSVGDATV
jgi:hypothetical protein